MELLATFGSTVTYLEWRVGAAFLEKPFGHLTIQTLDLRHMLNITVRINNYKKKATRLMLMKPRSLLLELKTE